ncbi:MAG: VOC family protein [Alphaproteobacteria bacterium]
MKTLNPYIFFHGRAREALDLYAKALDGTIETIQTFGEAGMDHEDPSLKDQIMHAEFRAGDIVIMAADGIPNANSVKGTNVELSIQLDDRNEQDRIFATLSEGGEVKMPLEEMFWGDRFGTLIDKFGIHWQLNCTK